VVLHMPTGAGKTRVAMHLIARHLREREDGLVCWLAYGRELCEQAAAEFETAWRHLGNRPLDVHRFWGSRSLALGDVSNGVVVSSLPKMYNAAKRDIPFIGRLGSRCTLAVIDEAHQAVAETYRLVLDALVVHDEDTGLLGLTATPGRTWSDISADEELADFFARQKVSLDAPGYDNPVRFLMNEGYLAETQFEPLHAESDVELSARDLQRVRENLNVPSGVLRKLAEDDRRNLSIVERLETLLERHRRVLFFATTVAHAELMATVLQARGHHAAAITAETRPAARARRIRRFKSDDDESRLLANYGVLTTGFDAPQTSAALIARPTGSLVLYSQMVGRAIRGPRAGGNAEAEIVTVIDRALPGFGSVADAFLNWEDVWD
jgi:superfamily II DNA or RNA helicase